jgi:hypothetical protein
MVTDEEGNPLPNIDVSVNPDGQGPGGFGRTDSSGRYVTSAVARGIYRVQFRDNGGMWASLYWNQQLTFGTATLLDLTAFNGSQRDGIDARLAQAASISGTVSNSSGAPVGNICIDGAIRTANGFDGVGQVQTGPDGRYTLGGLPAVPVKVRAQDCRLVGPYKTLWWPAATTFDAATPIDLSPGTHRQGIDFELPDAATISGTVGDANGPLAGICVQAVTVDAFGALTSTDGNGRYQLLLNDPGNYTIQFVDCTTQPRHAGWTRPGTVAIRAGDAISGLNATLAPGATATVSGSIRNGDGVAVTRACAVVYLANQYALFGPVAADGKFTVGGVPSGTYAVAFIGCDGGQPSDVVHDPVDPTKTYQAQWWRDVDLSLAGTAEGGPDPIAQGATLISVPPAGELAGFEQCFGCAAPPTTTTTTTSTTSTTTTTTTIATTSTTSTTAPTQLAITITGHTRAPGTITLTFTAAGALAASNAQLETVTYTALCTSNSGVVVRAHAESSPLVVVGVDDRARYACVIVATQAGHVLGRSAVVIVDPLMTGTLPATGAGSSGATWAAVVVTLLGSLLVIAVRGPRRAGRAVASGGAPSDGQRRTG